MLVSYMSYGVVYVVVECLSVTSRCSTEMAKHRIVQTTPHNSQGTLSFFMPKSSAKLKQDHPNRRAKCKRGRLKLATFNKYDLKTSTIASTIHLV